MTEIYSILKEKTAKLNYNNNIIFHIIIIIIIIEN